jgi:hypothetical protein
MKDKHFGICYDRLQMKIATKINAYNLNVAGYILKPLSFEIYIRWCRRELLGAV